MLLSSLSCGENNTYQGKYQETKDVEASIDKFCECNSPVALTLTGAAKKHFLINLIPAQSDIFQLFVAHSLQYFARLPTKPPFSNRSRQKYPADKRLFCPILVKFHPLPPRLARGFIFTDPGQNNTDSQNTFL